MKNTIIWVLLGLLVLSQIYSFVSKQETKISYVNWVELFDGFQMKEELESDYQAKIAVGKKELDSLSLSLQVMDERWKRDTTNMSLLDTLKTMWGRYQQLSKKVEQISVDVKAEYDAQIQKQMMQYLKEFGEEKDYDLLLGVMDESGVIYSKDNYQATSEALSYINKKYNDE